MNTIGIPYSDHSTHNLKTNQHCNQNESSSRLPSDNFYSSSAETVGEYANKPFSMQLQSSSAAADLSKAKVSASATADNAVKTSISVASAMTPEPSGTAIRLLFTNDLHGCIFPKQDKTDPNVTVGGFSMLSTLIEEKQSEKASLLLDAGDWAQGTFAGGLDKGKTVVKLMNELGYDASAAGNHEFDWGVQNFKSLTGTAQFSVLGANIIQEADGRVLSGLQPFVIKEIDGVKVGVIGLTSENTPFETSEANTAGVNFNSSADTIRQIMPNIKKAGADIVVLLSHRGTEEDKKLAAEVEGIDVIIGGHDHKTLKEPLQIGNTLIVQAGSHTSNLGQLDLIVDTANDEILSFDHLLTPISSKTSKPNPAFETHLAPITANISSIMNEKMGETTVSLSKKGKTAESAAGNLVTDAMRLTTGADISFINSGGMKKDIPKGDITFGSIYELLPYENKLITVEMTGGQVMAVLEDSASHAETTETFGNRYALQCSGIKVDIDPQKPAGSRCSNIAVNGKPLEYSKIYKVTSIDYLISSSNDFPSLHGGFNPIEDKTSLRDSFINYVKLKSPFNETNTGIEGRQNYI